MNLTTILAVFIGGGAGSVARWSVGNYLSNFTSFTPASVLSSNILATALLAGILIFTQGRIEKDSFWIPLLTIGFCGGFSTFSTFSLDTMKLFQSGNITWAILNIIISLVACIGVAWIMYGLYAKPTSL